MRAVLEEIKSVSEQDSEGINEDPLKDELINFSSLADYEASYREEDLEESVNEVSYRDVRVLATKSSFKPGGSVRNTKTGIQFENLFPSRGRPREMKS